MASRRSRAHHHPAQPPNVDAIRRRNWFLVLLVLVLLAFLLVYNRRTEVQLELATQRNAVQDAFLEIGGALDRYRTDFGAYPVETPGIYSASGMARLTTPHPYLWEPQITLDPFTQASLRVAMLDTTPAHWLLMSAGPDAQWQLLTLPQAGSFRGGNVREWVARFQYDPTNGSFSRGDILLLGR